MAALMVATGAQAQTFTISGTWGEVKFTGGVGEQGMAARSGNAPGKVDVALDDGAKVIATAHCVGMNQHPSQIFSLVPSCDFSRRLRGGRSGFVAARLQSD
ncbi:hypothetical protein GRI89_08110 [Altererythrobacter salegens]|uniref:Uncharacterized protein n=1 Tax=Croceibacterium salegens TaxID=1737568 RepID=A0A6I4SUF7_9SPHN|nr:hypothetical protein [Croceibacterium salegens]MXO59503.1 hypothetical protein [Croceibacterium salegens]